MKYKLGLKPLKQKLKLHLRNYLTLSKIPTPPQQVDWSEALSTEWGMMANDTVGDCFWAMAGHAFMTWSANAQAQQDVFTDEDILNAYSACTGYDPSDSSTDQGTDALEGFKFLRETGVKGHKFGPTVVVDANNITELRVAAFLFGGLCICTFFPQAWENAQVWDLTSSPVVGGHAIWGFGYDCRAVPGVPIATWGEERIIAWRALPKFAQQVSVTCPPEWIADNSLAPSGLNLKQLLADEEALSQGSE